MGALTAYRQRLPVAQAAIALNVDEALDVHRNVLAQVAFDFALVLNDLADAVHLFLAQILDLLEAIDVGLVQNLAGAGLTDPENVSERDPSLLVAGQIDASNTCHSWFPSLVVCLRP